MEYSCFCGVISPGITLPEVLESPNLGIDDLVEDVINEVGNVNIDEVALECDEQLVMSSGVEARKGLSSDEVLINRDHNLTTLVLPESYCQSTLGGRNGRNACTLIAVLVGFCSKKLKLTEVNDIPIADVLDQIVTVLLGSIEIGNFWCDIFDQCEFMTVTEAVGICPDKINVSVKREDNVFVGNGEVGESVYCFIDQEIKR